MAILESGEMYLETVFVLSQQSTVVRRIDIAEYLGYSKPSVSRAVGLLEKKGLVTTDDLGNIILTDEGSKRAQAIYERHTVLTRLFINLGVDPETAANDACRIEHYISEQTFDAIKAHMAEHGS